MFLCLPFWLKSEVKQRGWGDKNWENIATCEIEWDSHLTEETCKQLWFNYNGTEEYEQCDFKYRTVEFGTLEFSESDFGYEEFQCVSLKLIEIEFNLYLCSASAFQRRTKVLVLFRRYGCCDSHSYNHFFILSTL